MLRILFFVVLILAVCAGSLSLWAQESAPTAFSFVVFGDNQFATSNPTSGVPARMAVPEVIVSLAPTFILHTGDLMDHGYDPGAYDRFVEYYAGMLGRIPFFPTMGNHDAARGAIVNYSAYLKQQLFERNPRVYGPDHFAERFQVWHGDDPTEYPTRFNDPSKKDFMDRVPSGVSHKTFYAFRYRNVGVLSLEQGTRWWANTPMAWMEKHLRAFREDEGVDHIVVIMHHPMYSSTMREDPPDPANPGSGECTGPVRKIYEDLFRKYDVTLVFSGHAHLYDRFYVPDDETPTRAEQPLVRFRHDGSGIHYIVTGGGGGPLNKGNWRRDRSDAYMQNRVCAYHVVEVRVEDRALTVNAHLVSGTAENPQSQLFESFSITP